MSTVLHRTLKWNVRHFIIHAMSSDAFIGEFLFPSQALILLERTLWCTIEIKSAGTTASAVFNSTVRFSLRDEPLALTAGRLKRETSHLAVNVCGQSMFETTLWNIIKKLQRKTKRHRDFHRFFQLSNIILVNRIERNDFPCEVCVVFM